MEIVLKKENESNQPDIKMFCKECEMIQHTHVDYMTPEFAEKLLEFMVEHDHVR